MIESEQISHAHLSLRDELQPDSLAGKDPILVIEDDRGRREVVLDAPIYSIGRDSMCDIRLHSQFVSRRHATLVQLTDDDGTTYYRIVDGNLKGKLSVNGLLINNRKLRAYDLKDGDSVVFGPQVIATYHAPQPDTVSETAY